jgi:Tfp pilus assembly protein PilO
MTWSHALTELNPTSGRTDGAGVERFSRIAILAVVAGSMLILLNLFTLVFVLDKERVFAAAEEQLNEHARKVSRDQAALDAVSETKSILESKLGTLKSQIASRQDDLDTLASQVADQGAISTKLEGMRMEIQKAAADKAAAEVDRATAKDDLAHLN